jgi:hypothetical protein
MGYGYGSAASGLLPKQVWCRATIVGTYQIV